MVLVGIPKVPVHIENPLPNLRAYKKALLTKHTYVRKRRSESALLNLRNYKKHIDNAFCVRKITTRCSVAVFKSLTLKTIHGRRVFHTWPLIEAMVASKQVDVNKIISHRLPMTRYEEAFEALFSGEACKIVLYPNEVE